MSFARSFYCLRISIDFLWHGYFIIAKRTRIMNSSGVLTVPREIALKWIGFLLESDSLSRLDRKSLENQRVYIDSIILRRFRESKSNFQVLYELSHQIITNLLIWFPFKILSFHLRELSQLTYYLKCVSFNGKWVTKSAFRTWKF